MLLNTTYVGRDQQFGAFNLSEAVVMASGLRFTPGVLQFALGPVTQLNNVLFQYMTMWNNVTGDDVAIKCEVNPVSLCLPRCPLFRVMFLTHSSQVDGIIEQSSIDELDKFARKNLVSVCLQT